MAMKVSASSPESPPLDELLLEKRTIEAVIAERPDSEIRKVKWLDDSNDLLIVNALG